MQPSPYLEPEIGHGVSNRAGAADRAGGAVEAGEEAVARGVELNSPEER